MPVAENRRHSGRPSVGAKLDRLKYSPFAIIAAVNDQTITAPASRDFATCLADLE